MTGRSPADDRRRPSGPSAEPTAWPGLGFGPASAPASARSRLGTDAGPPSARLSQAIDRRHPSGPIDALPLPNGCHTQQSCVDAPKKKRSHGPGGSGGHGRLRVCGRGAAPRTGIRTEARGEQRGPRTGSRRTTVRPVSGRRGTGGGRLRPESATGYAPLPGGPPVHAGPDTRDRTGLGHATAQGSSGRAAGGTVVPPAPDGLGRHHRGLRPRRDVRRLAGGQPPGPYLP